MLKSPRVVAVVVAYNRRDLLVEVLSSLQEQQRPIDALVVVNNASTDDSADVVREHAPEATLVDLTRNTGGAGGFAVGMAAAVARHDPDWIWVMDDDTVPTDTALQAMMQTVQTYPRRDLVAVGSKVVWTDGSEHPMNTPRQNPFAERSERELAEALGSLTARSLSFVSSMYRADVVRRVGYPIADYFLWNDDFEYSLRVIRRGRALTVPASTVVHKTKALASTDADPGERFRFEVRNKIWLFGRSRCLRLGERVVYGGSSVVRWGRTFLRSADRGVLRSGLRQGFREGFSGPPRPNPVALADSGVPDDVAVELERVA